MAKALFRYLRGELNGYYLTNIHNTFNEYTKDIKNFLGRFYKMQFNNTMNSEYIYGIGKFAGVFLVRLAKSETKSALVMSDSYIENGQEYSERGLFNVDDEKMEYYPHESADINILATEELKSSLIGTENIIGFTSSEDTDILDDDGNVKESAIHSIPPSDVAYSDFYGNKFLFLSELTLTYDTINADLFFELYKALQWIRYNGESVTSLCKLISLICPNGLVKITSIESSVDRKRIIVYYDYDNTVELENKQQRMSLLQYVIGLKFTKINLIENI